MLRCARYEESLPLRSSGTLPLLVAQRFKALLTAGHNSESQHHAHQQHRVALSGGRLVLLQLHPAGFCNRSARRHTLHFNRVVGGERLAVYP